MIFVFLIVGIGAFLLALNGIKHYEELSDEGKSPLLLIIVCFLICVAMLTASRGKYDFYKISQYADKGYNLVFDGKSVSFYELETLYKDGYTYEVDESSSTVYLIYKYHDANEAIHTVIEGTENAFSTVNKNPNVLLWIVVGCFIGATICKKFIGRST